MKQSMISIFIIFLTILIIPTLIVIPYAKEEAKKTNVSIKQPTKVVVKHFPPSPKLMVTVYRSMTNKVDKVPFEDYLVGVVASEMPAEFKMEALKAQTLAARTYIVKQLLYPEEGLPKGAEVTDTPSNQVYEDPAQLKKVWGADYSWKIKRIRKAVKETNNEIITYKGEPITASFFSTSNGYTENSEDYWENYLPYLRSVKSPWDITESPKYNQTVEKPIATINAELGLHLSGQTNGELGQILSRTASHRVAKFKIGGKTFTGREVREKLGLASSDFMMTEKGSNVIISTKGYGHGVGMSQYGANGMAKEGKTYKQIIKYYYTGVDITGMSTFTPKLTAEK